jgi:DNA-binding NtrC family response regulator
MTKVLTIDDELIIQMSCERTLSSEGYEVKSASGGKEGIGILEKERFNLVLLDLKMPDMDGIEVLKLIRVKWPDTKVIIITGYGTDQTAEVTMKHGAHNFLEKPFTPDSLLSAINETM